jgi:outer membrane lipoprotein LolB
LLALAAVFAGCATAPRTGDVAPLAERAFTAEGRLSARHGNDAVSASFRWAHRPPRDELELGTPLGQVIAQLTGDRSVPQARVVLADGRSMEAEDFDALTQRALGFPLPVNGLAAWIRGGPHGASPFRAELDDRGRVAVLRQDGWEIVYEHAEAAAPARLRLTYPGVEVRIALDGLQ